VIAIGIALSSGAALKLRNFTAPNQRPSFRPSVQSSSILFFAGVCVILAAQTSSAQTVAVGNCRPRLVSYSTISAAVAAVTPNSTVKVCPGTYPEQVTITQPLTLKGLNDGTSARAIITVPRGGLVSPDLCTELGLVGIVC